MSHCGLAYNSLSNSCFGLKYLLSLVELFLARCLLDSGCGGSSYVLKGCISLLEE